MAKKKESKSDLTIIKSKAYSEHTIQTGLGKEADAKFNKFEKVKITKQQLKALGCPRWLEVSNG